jgi:UDP-N-acetylmuramoyl-tripeptide--D-alanyl-D-alanine ligase
MEPFHPHGARAVLSMMGEERQIQMACYGEPFLKNALAAAAAASAMGAATDEVVKGLAAFRPFPRRLNVISLDCGLSIIDDTYNANPVSMVAALEILRHLAQGRTLAVLGDMKELGPQTPEIHRRIGKRVAELGVEILFAVGEWAEEMSGGAMESGLPAQQTHACSSAQEALDRVLQTCAKGDWILVKGSRAVALERVVDGILKSLGQNEPLERRNVS